MKAYQTVIYEKKGGVATVALNRPDQMNALNMELLAELRDAMVDAQEDAVIRVIIITATGKAFCTGADLKMVNAWSKTGELDREAEKAFHVAADAAFESIEKCPKPIIAAVNGYAIAGGFEICLWSDLVIASEDARIGDGHATYMLLGPIAVNLLPRQIGMKKAMELLLTGDLWPARELEKVGFINQVVPPEELMKTAQEMAANVAEKSPLGLRHTKAIVKQAVQAPVDVVRELAFNVMYSLAYTKDRAEGSKAFEEKRKPNYTGE